MPAFEDVAFTAEEFSGRVRLFPLPNLVLFPHVLQPLHVFEPRYRELLEDALRDDRLIAMAVLEPGWESDYEGRPPLGPFACLGRVTAHRRLPDETHNILLLGLRRVRLRRELPPIRAFREARVDLCEDRYRPETAHQQRDLRRQLSELFLQIVSHLPEAQEQLGQLLDCDVPLGVLTDVISYMVDVGLRQKQRLLAEVDVVRRAEVLLGYLRAIAQQRGRDLTALTCFPPLFSFN